MIKLLQYNIINKLSSGVGEGGAEGAIDPLDFIQGGQKYNFAPPTTLKLKGKIQYYNRNLRLIYTFTYSK